MAKSVFITGAAQGIGLAAATYFHRQGWFVGLYDINEKGLESTHRQFTRSCYGVLDVRDEDAVANAFKEFSLQTGGQADVVVNCAGVLSSGYFEDIDTVASDRMIDINVKGLTYVARHALPLLKQTPNSVLVNICSASSIYGVPLLGVYGATKHYVNGLTQALSIEWQRFGIRVKAIKPPIVKTAMGLSLPSSFDKHMAADMDAQYVAEAIWKSISGSKVSYILGLKTQCLGLLCRWLPDTLARALMKRSCGL
jgi:NAD(P)-dependent dehydrogenase (short-subunit alcohol dehydrogenase family)